VVTRQQSALTTQRLIHADVSTNKNKMRIILQFLLLIALTSNALSQVVRRDTINIEIKKKVTKSPWALKFGLGGLYHQMPNQTVIKDQMAYKGCIALFYNHVFLKSEIFSIDFKPQKLIFFDDYLFDENCQFTSINLNTELGYSLDFNYKWGADFKLGANITDFDLVSSDDFRGSYTSDMIAGAVLGLTLNRHIKLRELKYLVIGLNIDYYTTNYRSVSRDLKRSSLNYSFDITYKFWYSKRIKETDY